MNRYDDFFDFRMGRKQDIDVIMQFIRENWDPIHILGNDREFFEYHYGNGDNGINVFLMLDKRQEIAGIIGFIRYSSNNENNYVTISIIKVKNALPLPMCGVEFMKRFYENFSALKEFGCGVNPKTMLPIYDRVFKYHTGRMDQFYYLNTDIKDYKVITVRDSEAGDISKEHREFSQYELLKLENIEDTEFDFEKEYDRLPFKDKEFINKRYFYHPIFDYTVYEIKNGEPCKGLIFTRKINYNGGSIILIVDVAGEIESLGHIQKALDDILKKENAECFSFLVTGVPHEILGNSGFRLLAPEQKDVIIPTYFEPFVNANIDNYYISSEEDIIICKASGDQDNPKHRRGNK